VSRISFFPNRTQFTAIDAVRLQKVQLVEVTSAVKWESYEYPAAPISPPNPQHQRLGPPLVGRSGRPGMASVPFACQSLEMVEWLTA
jgi:hypothetical protein